MYIKRRPLGEGLTFRKKKKRFPILGILLYLLVLAVSVYVFLHLDRYQPQVIAMLEPEPTPTLSPDVIRAMGDEAYMEGELHQAADYYRQAYELAPDDLGLMFDLSRVLTLTAQLEDPSQDAQVAANLDEAVTVADEMILLAPEDWRGYAAKSRALDYQGRAQDAAVQALRAVELAPDSSTAHAYLAEAYTDLGQYRQAREHGEQAITLDPYSIDARRNYAYILEHYGDYGGAVQQYQQALQLHGELLDLYYGLARNYRGMGEIEKSVETYRQIILRQPEEPRPRVELGRTFFEIREDDAAQAELSGAVELLCDDCPRYTYEELERIDFEYDPALLPENMYEPAWRRLGQVYHTRRNYEDAVAINEELVQWYETRGEEASVSAYLVLASAYYYIDSTVDGDPLCDRALMYAQTGLDIYERDRLTDPNILNGLLSVFVLCRDYANTPPSQPVEFPRGYAEPDVEVRRPGQEDTGEETPSP